ncbi:MAG: MFS transporter [Treponema sp.]|nr:MFS transporter [Treponema sp.]
MITRSERGSDPSAAGPGSTLSVSEYSRATRLAVVAGGFAAVFLTVCSNQPITAVYLTNHLKASPELLGALFGFIQATGALQLFSVFIYRVLPRRKPFFIAAHLVHRTLGLALAASALLFLGGMRGEEAATFAAIGIGVSWIFMSLSTSGWLSWMADLVPEDVRGSFFLKRSAVYQTIVVIWFFLANVALDLVPDSARSIAYAVIFGVGAAGGLVDILIHIKIPEPIPQREEGRMKLGEFLAPLRDRNFLRYSLGIGIAVFAVFVGSPFQAPRVTDPSLIGAPNVWLGIMTVITILAWVAMAPLWGFVMDRYGRKPAVILGCLLVSGWVAYFFVDHHNYSYLLPIVALVAGFFGPAFWEGSGQLMLTLAPPARRVAYIAWYNTIVGLVSAVGSPLGGFLIAAFPPGTFAQGALAQGGLAHGALASGLQAALSGPLARLEGFHLAQATSLVSMALAMLLIRGVREGRERPVAGLIGQMASAGLFRTYASLLDLKRHSGDPRVARALRRIDGDEGEMVIREVIERLDDPEPETREEALRALARIGSAESRRALETRLADPGCDLRVEAARALGRLGDAESVSALETAMKGGDPVLRAACAGAIASLSGKADGSRLAAILRAERDPAVLEAAALGASVWCSDEDMGASELVDAAIELAGRLCSARNRASRLQYAIGIANLLGKPGEFARLSTGGEELRAAKRRAIVDAFALRFEEIHETGGSLALGASVRATVSDSGVSDADSKTTKAPAVPALPVEALLTAFDAGDGTAALDIVIEAGQSLVKVIFGAFAEASDIELLMRADARLASWTAVAGVSRERLRFGDLAPRADDEAALLIALVGAWYFSAA